MGKCTFKETWLDHSDFCSWLQVVPSSRYEACVARFGLGGFIKRELIRTLTRLYVVMFDESLNQTSLTSTFVSGTMELLSRGTWAHSSWAIGHWTAQDLLKHVKESLDQLDVSRLISVSMNGPNVNFKFLELLQLDHAENYGGAQLVSVGSCGLHTLHNAFKAGFSMWHVDKILKAMHTLFHHVPARKGGLVHTKSTVFPQPFPSAYHTGPV
ncbi:unnamed protein product [Leuciscus chuanchicus]